MPAQSVSIRHFSPGSLETSPLKEICDRNVPRPVLTGRTGSFTSWLCALLRVNVSSYVVVRRFQRVATLSMDDRVRLLPFEKITPLHSYSAGQ